MALKHVVLFAVGESPGHGYAIHRRVSQILPALEGCDSSRVYGILTGLARDGLVQPVWEAAERGRVRKRYVQTRAGGEELRSWLDRPRPSRGPLRRELLVWSASGGRLSAAKAERALGVWGRQRDRHLGAREGEECLARWDRLREVARLQAEMRMLREWASEDAQRPRQGFKSSVRPSSPGPPVRSSASR